MIVAAVLVCPCGCGAWVALVVDDDGETFAPRWSGSETRCECCGLVLDGGCVHRWAAEVAAPLGADCPASPGVDGGNDG